MTEEQEKALEILAEKLNRSSQICNPYEFANRNYELLIQLTKVVLMLGNEFEQHLDGHEEEDDERTSFGEWVKTEYALPPFDVPFLTCRSGYMWVSWRREKNNLHNHLGDYWCFLPPLPGEQDE